MDFNDLEINKEKSIEFKFCTECKLNIEINNFSTRKRATGYISVSNICNACHYKKYKDKYSLRNHERYKDEEFREKKKQYTRDYRIKNPELIMWQSAKSRCKMNNITFNIELTDIVIPDICPILEIPLKRDNGDYEKFDSPSLDRVNPKLGYTKGNIKVISHKANAMKQDCDLEQLELFCKNILNYMK